MSASAPRAKSATNPATKFIKWRAGDEQGWFDYYDKTIEDKTKRNVRIDLSKGFLILDEDLFIVTGYIEQSKTGIVSNEVRDINDMLTVKGYTPDGKNQVLLKGTYSDLKETIRGSRDYAYTKSIYIMLYGELCHLSLSGAAFSQWLADVQPNSNHANRWISHTGTEDKKKGNVKFKVPCFTVGAEANDKDWGKVVDLDSNVLQPYLEVYLGRSQSSSPDGNAQSGDAGHEHETIDTAKWREAKSPSGVALGEMTNEAIQHLSEMLVEEGKDQTHLYDYVGQALYDYQSAVKVWEQKADASGRKLADYTLAELKVVLTKIGMSHKYSIFIQAAIDAKSFAEAENAPFFKEDDIPF